MRKDYNLEKRKYVIAGLAVVIVLIYAMRLFELQLSDSSYKANADSNAFVNKTIYPSRGLIYDRNGKLIVYNQPAYDLVVVPHDVQDFDTIDFCNTLQISRATFDECIERMKSKHGYSPYVEQTFLQHLTPEDYARMQEKLYRFPGFYFVRRILREYNYPVAANVLGDIREVNADDIDRDSYYKPGDYTGDLGIERSYEKYLRGVKGQEVLIRDAMGKIQGHYKDGALDKAPVAGNDLKLSIDIDLQAYGELLMRGKLGAIVAIEPSTGEILALVSSPGYDPSLLVGKSRGKNYGHLASDPLKPLFDRAIQAAYPPGSTFKPTQGLIFRQEGIVNLSTMYPCSHGYYNQGMHVGCHGHASPIALLDALGTSCNSYFCWGFFHMIGNKKRYGSTASAFEVWKRYLVSMGYGYKLGIDLPGESRGFIPNAAYYDKNLGPGHWVANSIISVSIGQGEVLATPLQIANLCATIANRGYYITPHVVKNIVGVGILKKYTQPHRTAIDPKYYVDIVEGMRRSVEGGTSHRAHIPGIQVCGKTGTAQNPHGKDHSVFMGFAPMDHPRIAIAVFVENAGFGATYGVPIGTLMMEKYLTGKITNTSMQSEMLNSSTISRPKPKDTGVDVQAIIDKFNRDEAAREAQQAKAKAAKQAPKPAEQK